MKKINNVMLLIFALSSLFVTNVANASYANIKKETKQKFYSIKSYSAKKKKEATESIKHALNDLDAQIEYLEDSTQDSWSNTADNVKAKKRIALKKLRKARISLGEKSESLKYSTEESWEDLKDSLFKSWNEVEEAYKELS